jgi:hypothetical protein
MNGARILGVVLLVVGVVLLIFGINATDRIGEQLTEGVTGRYSDRTMWYIIGGIAMLVAGGAITFFGGRAKV